MPDAAPLQDVRVLVAHRDARLCREVTDLLGPLGAAVLCASGAVPAADAVRRRRPHVVLLEHGLDDRGSHALVRDVAGDPDLLGTAVILLRPGAGVDEVVDALAAGAVDVWAADGAGPELVARVRSAFRSGQLLDLALRRYADLENLAYNDELTELPNRRGATRQLEVLVSRARRHAQQLAVLLVDADRFKSVNDRYGHAAGDLVLREMADRLRDRVRREDLVGRWGGEEFVVALPETTAGGAAAVAESLRCAVAAAPFGVGEETLGMTVSIGVAAWSGGELPEVVARADRALYAAKAAGRDRVMVEDATQAA